MRLLQEVQFDCKGDRRHAKSLAGVDEPHAVLYQQRLPSKGALCRYIAV